MTVTSFDWDDENESHLAGHNITQDEAEEIVSTQTTVFRAHPHVTSRFFAYGRTSAGRWLTVLFDVDEAGSARPFTGWNMKPGELTKYAR